MIIKLWNNPNMYAKIKLSHQKNCIIREIVSAQKEQGPAIAMEIYEKIRYYREHTD